MYIEQNDFHQAQFFFIIMYPIVLDIVSVILWSTELNKILLILVKQI